MAKDARRIAALLNACSSGNILDHHDQEISKFIQEYFVADGVEEEWSDQDEDDEEDKEEDEDNTDTVLAAVNKAACDEENVIEEPVVTVEGPADVSNDVMAGNDIVLPAMLQDARTWSCGCVQIKVANKAADDRRNGCIAQFTPDEIVAFQLSMQGLDKDAKDLIILGNISACLRNGEKTECSRRKEQLDRQKPRSTYSIMARLVCTKTFCRFYCMSEKKLKALRKHYLEHGLEPRQLRNGGRRNASALTLQDTDRVVKFIRNYAEDHAVLLPGRVPGFKRDDIRLLPSSAPKSRIYRLYRQSAQTAGHRVVAASTFRKLWLQLCPYIVVARPMTDLCWRCQQNNSKIYQSANLTTEEKQEALEEHQRHLAQVEAERKYYRDCVEQCKIVMQQENLVSLQQTPPNSRDITAHYSFDFAQQIHYPNNSAQPGPIYFLTPRKCAIFGTCCEGLPQQVNYLIDEAVNTSKGSNGVISYLHHFFTHYGVGEKSVQLHCDNCSGQNKNKYLFWYCAWRILTGLHSEISVNFMPPGHTKFAPDWCFGLIKRCFRRSEVSCLEDMCTVVEESTAESHFNIPQLVGHEDGTVLVPTYDWQSFLTPSFKTFPGIKKIGHFRFSVDNPGNVLIRMTLADQEEEKQLLLPGGMARLRGMPQVLPPPGLSRERQMYLYNSIREFVRQEKRDIVCPRPGQ